jgi:hypothetical protein
MGMSIGGNSATVTGVAVAASAHGISPVPIGVGFDGDCVILRSIEPVEAMFDASQVCSLLFPLLVHSFEYDPTYGYPSVATVNCPIPDACYSRTLISNVKITSIPARFVAPPVLSPTSALLTATPRLPSIPPASTTMPASTPAAGSITTLPPAPELYAPVGRAVSARLVQLDGRLVAYYIGAVTRPQPRSGR